MENTKEPFTFTVPRNFMPDPVPPSAFEIGAAEQLKALAEQLESGAMHIKHFSLTVFDDKQRLEIEVY